jgi:glycosyltransferase involved in cell wall biosynthesis
MKTRIMHLTYDMGIGGTEQVIKSLIEGSDTDLFDMSIFCIEEPIGAFGNMVLEQGTAITSHQRKAGFDLNLLKAIRKHIKRNAIDILHCHQYTPWVYGALAAIGLKKKVVFTEHGRFYPDLSSWKRKLINPLLVNLTARITAISQATKKALNDFEFIPEMKIDVIYNGIKPLQVSNQESKLLRQELGIKDKTIVLGTIARLDPIKNHTMMLNAFSSLLKKHTPCFKTGSTVFSSRPLSESSPWN